MKKVVIYLSLIIFPYLAFSQKYSRINPNDSSYEILDANQNQIVYKSKFPQWFIFFADTMKFKAIDSTKFDGAAISFLWANKMGVLKVSLLDSMFGRNKFYNHIGLVNQKPYKVYSDTITATTGNGFSIDISNAAFTQILSVQVQPEFSTTDPNLVPAVAVKSWNNTTIIVNVVNQNRVFVSLLSLTISLGLQFVNNIKLHVTVVGY